VRLNIWQHVWPQGFWLAQLLGDLRRKAVECVELKVYNQSALALMKNHVFHDKSKHIRTRYHFIRQSVEDGEIHPDHISSEEQLADILTKHSQRRDLRSWS
jgi:hypothetical protein